MLAIGTFIGPIAIGYAMLVAAFAGLAAHVVIVAFRGKQWGTPLPFGQWLALGGAALFIAQALNLVAF
jgi:prepilin signal peptidase PulO-like enzyme (type II secretory pathway)